MAAAGTSVQAKAGIEDTPELMYQDMLKAGLGLNHPELVKIVTDRSNLIRQWTIDYLGVCYKDRVDQFGGHSVPRCYTTTNNSGADIIKKLLVKVEDQGMQVRRQACLKRILTDVHGAVRGVAVLEGCGFPQAGSGRIKRIKANKAVVLASGGFGSDIAFRTVQDPRLTAEVGTTNHDGATAEALTAALEIGAGSLQLSLIQLGPWASPDEKGYGVGPDFSSYIAFPYGLMVDPATGKRFVNELADRKTRADAILNIGHPCIGIADAEGVRQSGRQIDRCLKRGVVKAFDTLEHLAAAFNIAYKNLDKTARSFNTFVTHKKDEDFGKPILQGAEPLAHPPYYGIRLWPKVHYTMGGIHINPRAQVIGLTRKPIRGLYAAGEVVGGVHGASRLGSCAITDCLIFGRIAGQNAATDSQGDKT
jgi:flavocytochrome c